MNSFHEFLGPEQLKKFGLEAEIASNGCEAVQAVQTGTFDLVLMDCQMPDLDGLAATRRIRAWELESHAPRRVPIIALTSGTVLGIRDECLRAGMDHYLSKPVRWAELRTAVRQLIPRLAVTAPAEDLSPTPRLAPRPANDMADARLAGARP